MKLTGWAVAFGLTSMSLAALVDNRKTSSSTAPTFETSVLPFIKRHCVACHVGPDAPGGVDLASVTRANQMVSDPALWNRVARAIGRGTMPPAGRPKLAGLERESVVGSIQAILAAECRLADPGRVTLRRLNRAEYENSVRDLTGVTMNLADDFPSDDVGYGFDNIGDVLSLSPLLMEKYLAAAERVAGIAIVLPDRRVIRVEGENFTGEGGASLSGEDWSLYAKGSVRAHQMVSKAGDYRIDIVAYGDQAGPEPAKMTLTVGSKVVQQFDVPARRAQPGTYSVRARLPEGHISFAVDFINDYYQPNDPNPQNRDRNLHVLSLSIDGPLNSDRQLPAGHRMLVPPTLTNQTVSLAISKLALRAYRRPPTAEEIAGLQKLYQIAIDAGEPSERGLQLVLQALLASPKFLFRAELDSGKDARPLNGYELASRISYFLWSSIPDEALLASAGDGTLLTEAGLKSQIGRMLGSPKSRALIENFVGQWLQLRKLDVLVLDPDVFPEATPKLMASMKKETEMAFEALLQGDQPLLDLVKSDTSFINGELAKHYGIPDVEGTAHQKVSVSKYRTGGILGHASILALTSNPTRTSPVKRGKWILENLLGDPTPPPPPNVGVLDEKPNVVTGKTLRLRLEQHRKKPECAGCHARLDPWGLAMEAYDPLGRKRQTSEGEPIDLLVTLPDGSKMAGPADVKAQVLKREPDFVRCFVEKLMTYAVGRGMTPQDTCHIDQVVSEVKPTHSRLQSIVLSVIRSKPFRMKGSTP